MVIKKKKVFHVHFYILSLKTAISTSQQKNCNSLHFFSLSGPEDGALSPSSSSRTEEQDLDMETMATASLSQMRGGGSITGIEGGGESRRRLGKEGEIKQRTGGGGLGPPDLDLDQVEEEAREEERRSHTVRQKEKRDGQREQGSRSRSLPRNIARSLDTSPPKERVEVEHRGAVKEKKRMSEMKRGQRITEVDREEEEKRKDRKGRATSHAKDSGSFAPAQRSAFSFLGPIEDNEEEPRRLSDSESAASFSEVSQSAASITTTEWREDSDWRAASQWEQGKAPGPWLKPSPQRLTQVLIGNRLSERGLMGGLSL